MLEAVFAFFIAASGRSSADTFFVTRSGESGEGTLRWAIERANATVGGDTVRFALPPGDPGFNGAVWILRPRMPLPPLTGGNIFIHGSSQTEWAGETNAEGPEVALYGDSLESFGSGLVLTSEGNRISGLVVSGFPEYGICVSGPAARNNRITGNYIGTEYTGSRMLSNEKGIILIGGSAKNTIGGVGDSLRNVISGNHGNGIMLSDSDENWIMGNTIGADRLGLSAIPNGQDMSNGIWIGDSSRSNIVGGDVPGSGNLVSGNYRDGIHISTAHNNRILGNWIGLDATGSAGLPNGQVGVGDGMDIRYGSTGNQIGGTTPAERNVISANPSVGIRIHKEGTDGNRVTGNYIGTDASGTVPLGNGLDGVFILDGARSNVIGDTASGAGNRIACNRENGITIEGSGTDGNIVMGNWIGTGADGEKGYGNGLVGVRLTKAASGNRIGPGNTIAFSGGSGVSVEGSGTGNNRISRNAVYGNGGSGIALLDGANAHIPVPVLNASHPLSGTSFPNAHIELFSDSLGQGRWFEAAFDADAEGHFNWYADPAGPGITCTATDDSGNTSEFSNPVDCTPLRVTHTRDSGEGSLRWAMDLANQRAGADTITFRIPEDDAGFTGTVWVIRPLSDLPLMEDCGTIISGESQSAFDNANPGGPEIMLDGSGSAASMGLCIHSSGNVIRGLIISGFSRQGIRLEGMGASGNVIQDNFIGTDASGGSPLANGTGISLLDGAGKNRIGGTLSDGGNLISGNRGDGIHISDSDSNTVSGNRVGTDALGSSALGNGGDGVDVRNGSVGNLIGGTGEGGIGGNLFSANTDSGINLAGEGTRGNTVSGNWIGTDEEGDAPLGNGLDGIYIYKACSNTIGGPRAEEANVISANRFNGITLEGAGCDSNQVIRNLIGTDQFGFKALGNVQCGIAVLSGAKRNHMGQKNIISGNGMHGILISGSGTDSNTVAGTWIGLNAAGRDSIPNQGDGIRIERGARDNGIGGPGDFMNVISANRQNGCSILDFSTSGNCFENNWFGTDTSGTVRLGNHLHGLLIGGSRNTVSGSLISGNDSCGVLFNGAAYGNRIEGNSIGTDWSGLISVPNGASGVLCRGTGAENTIGPGNRIQSNHGFGIALSGAELRSMTITRNSISANDSGGILIRAEANQSVQAPVIVSASPVSGTAPPLSLVEIFSDSANQGCFFEDSVRCGGDGRWEWTGMPSGPYITATATDTAGNTSAFSDSLRLTPSGETGRMQAIPAVWSLGQNYPNPFNPETMIRYGVVTRCRVVMDVFNLLGQKVATLIDRIHAPGTYEIHFDASGLSSGLYFYRITMGEFTAMRKMVLLE